MTDHVDPEKSSKDPPRSFTRTYDWRRIFDKYPAIDAWTKVVTEMQPLLTRRLTNAGISSEKAECLIADTYIALVDGSLKEPPLFEYRSDQETRAFVFKRLGWAKSSRLRKEAREDYSLDIDLMELEAGRSGLDTLLVADLVARLSDERQRLIYLKYHEDLRTREVAQRMGMSSSWVRAELAEARKQIANWYLDAEGI